MSSKSPRDDINFDLKKILCRPSAFGPGSLVPPKVRAGHKHNPSTSLSDVQNAKVLVVGAGGIGCELLKNLALSGFRKIWVVDADEIDVTNLNRQFLFRKKDVGRGKAETAANFVQTRIPGLDIKTFNCFIQSAESHEDFDFSEFDIVINGLDNLAARTWVGDKVLSLVEYGADGTPTADSVKPLIDGGTEGYDGQIHVVVPYYTLDFAGRSWMFPKRNTVAMCTLASNPRKPEHCILFVMQGGQQGCWKHMARQKVAAGEWEAVNPFGDGRDFNTDDPSDMKWITERSIERAQQFNLAKGTPLGESFDKAYFFVLGVVKSIIPAIGSTNAIVAALSVAEAIKIVGACSQATDNFAYLGAGAGFSTQLQSLVLDDLTKLPIKMFFPVTAETTVGSFKQEIIDSFIFNCIVFKYSTSVYRAVQKGRTDATGQTVRISIGAYDRQESDLHFNAVRAVSAPLEKLSTVSEVRSFLEGSGALDGCDLSAGYFIGRYRPSDATKEAGGEGMSHLPYHGYWLYDSDDAALALDQGSELFVFPKLPSVSLFAADNSVPMGEAVNEKLLKADLNAEHGDEFKFSNVFGPKHNAGEPPRSIALVLYFTDEDSSDEDSSEDGDSSD